MPWQAPICILILALNAVFFVWTAKLAPADRSDALQHVSPMLFAEGVVMVFVAFSLMF